MLTDVCLSYRHKGEHVSCSLLSTWNFLPGWSVSIDMESGLSPFLKLFYSLWSGDLLSWPLGFLRTLSFFLRTFVNAMHTMRSQQTFFKCSTQYRFQSQRPSLFSWIYDVNKILCKRKFKCSLVLYFFRQKFIKNFYIKNSPGQSKNMHIFLYPPKHRKKKQLSSICANW